MKAVGCWLKTARQLGMAAGQLEKAVMNESWLRVRFYNRF
jgi:hypothetical protein